MSKKEMKVADSGQMKLDLFNLDPLIDKNYSNTLEILDVSGLFVYNKLVKYMTQATAEETEFRRKAVYHDIEINYSITAANIRRKSGERAFVHPGIREEIVWEALKKMASDGKSDGYEMTEGRLKGQKLVGINTTLYDIYCELVRVNKSYPYEAIRESLEILNRAILSISSSDGSIALVAPYLPIMAISDGNEEESTKVFACFHPMVTEVIYSLNFRRYDYVRCLSFSGHFTRAIYKRLCHRWVQAAKDKPYTILLSTLIHAMKTPADKLYHDKETFVNVFEELIKENVLTHYNASPKKEGRKVVDWLFELYPTEAFSKQIAANNKVKQRILGEPEQYRPIDQSC